MVRKLPMRGAVVGFIPMNICMKHSRFKKNCGKECATWGVGVAQVNNVFLIFLEYFYISNGANDYYFNHCFRTILIPKPIQTIWEP